MSHEFELHHFVSELMKHLGLTSKGAEVFANMLEKSINHSVGSKPLSSDEKKRISESVKHPQAFLAKYDALKSKNIKELDDVVCLVAKLLRNDQAKELVERSVKVEENVISRSITLEQVNQLGSKFTPEELWKIKDELNKATLLSSSAKSGVRKKILPKEGNAKQVDVIKFPSWIHERPLLSLDFHPEKNPTEPSEDLKAISVARQEALLVDDLLFCCEGIEGKFIKCNPLSSPDGSMKFTVDPGLDSSLKEMVSRIVPACGMYSDVVRFVEGKYDFQCGLVNQALVAAIVPVMEEYSLLIARLEHQQRLGKLGLQKFWFYIQPTIHTLGVLSSVVKSIGEKNCRGGAVLTLLHEKTLSMLGDEKAQQLCFLLTRAACVPYLEILESWIYRGIISDPYFEFMVEEDDSFQKEKLSQDFNDAYWEMKYTLKVENVPVFLEKVANNILKTGKYLNVIRECGRDVSCPSAETLEYTLNERQFVDKIEDAVQYASSLLLDMLMKEMDLMARLRSMKHYFLLDQGDFVVLFMDMAKDELKKPMGEILLSRLESLLELALRTSTANADPYKDDLKVDLLPYDLTSQLFKILTIETKQEKAYKFDPCDLNVTGLESFTFDYVVRWPISLVLNRKALARYQILFRYLFYSKYVEQQLCKVWVQDKLLKMFVPQSTFGSRAYALRQRMLNFVQNFEYYVMLEVIEPHWQLFESNMSKVTNVDEVLSHHADLLNNCLKDSMLTNPTLLKIYHKMMINCMMFCSYMKKLNVSFEPRKSYTSLSSVADKDKKKVLASLTEHMDEITQSESYERMISNFETYFATELADLMNKIVEPNVTNSEHKFMNVIHRLDFNGFYTKQLEDATKRGGFASS